jgi:ElaB/YqjD/DUF883 family membrane-anchored ribosome-binding protein
MGIQDRLKRLTKKAEEAGAEHKQQLEQAVHNAEAAADRQTGGQYHDQIQKAGEKADAYVKGLKPREPSETPPSTSKSSGSDST